MTTVYVKKEVPENCSTCLYFTGMGCAHADRENDWLKYAMLGFGCPSYWLNQHKYKRAD